MVADQMFEFAKEFIVGACDQIYRLSGTSHGADKLTMYWKLILRQNTF